MTQSSQLKNSNEQEISLFDILNFIKTSWKTILSLAFAGFAVAVLYLISVPPQYEAAALIEMARVPDQGMKSMIAVEMPALLIERLKSPSTYTPEVIKVCGFDKHATSSESLAKAVKTTLPKNLSSIIQITIRRDTPILAKECVTSLFHMIRMQQMLLNEPYEKELKSALVKLQLKLRENQDFLLKAEKTGLFQTAYLARRDELAYLTERIDEFQSILSRITPTRLVAQPYASPNKVAPKDLMVLMLGTSVGLILGLLIAVSYAILNNLFFRKNESVDVKRSST